MTVVLREFKQQEVSPDELKLLLSFVEEDIHDYQRQGTAFPLLKVSILYLPIYIARVLCMMMIWIVVSCRFAGYFGSEAEGGERNTRCDEESGSAFSDW